jgi:hypothetical protein
MRGADGWSRRAEGLARGRGLIVALVAASVTAIAVLAGSAAAKTKPAYCNIPTVSTAPWAFHVNSPIFATTGTYAHGHGTLGTSSTGIICQVDRVKGAADRQIIISVYGGVIQHVHGIKYDGFLANILQLHMKVTSSTDSSCTVGTKGELTLIATYNSIHHDEVQLAWGKTCADHDHVYTGPEVTALIPP